jgi:hypothetical protein
MKKPLPTAAHLEFEPRAADLLELLRDLGHLDEGGLEAIVTPLVTSPRSTNTISYEEVRRAAALLLFEREPELRADMKEALGAEWLRIFG